MEGVAFGVGMILGLGVCIGIETVLVQEKEEEKMFGLVLSAVAGNSIASAVAGGAVATMTAYVAVRK